MWGSFGQRTSLLNHKIKHGLYAVQKESIEDFRRNKLKLELRTDYSSDTTDDKNISVFYMIDIKRHLPKHDEIVLQQLTEITMNVNVMYVKVFFENTNLDKKLFKRLCNLIRLNVPKTVLDIFPKNVLSIYEYIKNLDDDNYNISLNPYIESMDLMKELFENTIGNIEEYKKFGIGYRQNCQTTHLCMGMLKNSTSFFFNYFWMIKINSEGQNGITYESIFKVSDLSGFKNEEDFNGVELVRVE